MGAGKLRELIAFEVRQNLDDGFGNEVSGPWQEQCRANAERLPLKGGEAVLASRLQGKQPYLLTVYWNLATSQVTPDWRAVDVRTGAVYAIQTAVARERRDYIDMMCVEGVAE